MTAVNDGTTQMAVAENPRSALAPTVAEAVVHVLEQSERVVASAECMRRLHLQLFEKVTIVATDRRLMVAAPAFPWGHTIRASYPLGDCAVVNGKERMDGSRLLIIRHLSGNLCVYFSRHQQQEADWIVEAVGLAPRPEEPHADPVVVNMELHALSEPDPEDD